MATECNAREFDFQGLGSRAVTARFDGGAITSDQPVSFAVVFWKACQHGLVSCTLFSWRFLLSWWKAVRATPSGPEEPPFSISTTSGTTSSVDIVRTERGLERLSERTPF